MNDRFITLYNIPKKVYCKGSPIIIESAYLRKDSVSGSIFAQLKFKSIAEKTIQAVIIGLTGLSVTNEELDTVSYQYLDLSCPPYSTFGDNKAILIKNNLTRQFTFKNLQVVFDDGSIWKKAADEPFLELAEPVLLKNSLPDELYEFYISRHRFHHSDYTAYRVADLWLCTCGEINRTEICHHCNREKEKVFESCDAALLREEYNRIREEQARELARIKREKEEREKKAAELARLQKEKEEREKKERELAEVLKEEKAKALGIDYTEDILSESVKQERELAEILKEEKAEALGIDYTEDTLSNPADDEPDDDRFSKKKVTESYVPREEKQPKLGLFTFIWRSLIVILGIFLLCRFSSSHFQQIMGIDSSFVCGFTFLYAVVYFIGVIIIILAKNPDLIRGFAVFIFFSQCFLTLGFMFDDELSHVPLIVLFVILDCAGYFLYRKRIKPIYVPEKSSKYYCPRCGVILLGGMDKCPRCHYEVQAQSRGKK